MMESLLATSHGCRSVVFFQEKVVLLTRCGLLSMNAWRHGLMILVITFTYVAINKIWMVVIFDSVKHRSAVHFTRVTSWLD